MTQVAHQLPAPHPALIVFGTDGAGRPHASWFSGDEVEDAERASSTMGYTALRVTRESAQGLAVRLPRGHLCRNGRAKVPLLSTKLFDLLAPSPWLIRARHPQATPTQP